MKISGSQKLLNIFIDSLRKPQMTLLWLILISTLSGRGLATSVDLGPTLPVLNKMQGAWKTTCHAAGGTVRQGYRIDYLNVTYTHLDFSAVVYSDDTCLTQVSKWPAKYRFILGRPLTLASGREAFELNLEEISDPADAWLLSPANIIQLDSGKLYLGQENSFGTQSTHRIEKLNIQSPFFRR